MNMSGLKVVFINGPPRVGKDTAGKILSRHRPGSETVKFADPVKRITHAVYNLPACIPLDEFEDSKGVANLKFDGLTPRQAYIRISERMVKPEFGEAYFGTLAVKTLNRMTGRGITMALFTDSGFYKEAEPVVASVGVENSYLIRLHADDRGCSFAGDSRSHIELPGVKTIDIHNDGSIEEFETVVRNLIPMLG